LYQGNSFVIYYAPNTWSLTRLGKIKKEYFYGIGYLIGEERYLGIGLGKAMDL